MATVGELDVNTLVDTTPDKMSEIKASKFRSTLKYVKAISVGETMTDVNYALKL